MPISEIPSNDVNLSMSFALVEGVTVGGVPPANLKSGLNDKVPAPVALFVTSSVIC